MIDTFEYSEQDDFLFDKLAIIELALAELSEIAEQTGILSEEAIEHLQKLRKTLEKHTDPRTYADASKRADRLLRASAGMNGTLWALRETRKPPEGRVTN